MGCTKLFITAIFILNAFTSSAQVDSVLSTVQQIPAKYLTQVNNKIDKYSNRLSSKTEKTLTRLSRWEEKIHALLLKASPATAERLFAPNVPTFTSLLQRLKQGEAAVQNYKSGYDNYRDKLNTSIQYIAAQKEELDANYINKAKTALAKTKELDQDIANSEATEKFIRERKKQLISESLKYIGKSKYLLKMNKEAYYYVETLRNYKEIFSDKAKTEEVALKVLNNIPGFSKYMQQNGQLGGLFASPSGFPTLAANASVPIVNGLPTRAAMQQYMQTNVPTMANVNLGSYLQGSVSELKGELDKLKSLASGGNMDNDGLPDFKPNSQKVKPFFKRFEYSTDIQFGKSQSYIPANTKIGAGIGYKLNDKLSAGVGINYVFGLGSGWNDIHFTNEGIGFRTYIKSKLKRGFAIQGGSEWNYNLQFDKISQLRNAANWQQSALLGISKSLAAGKKVKTNIQLLYDFLYSRHVPVSQPFVLRYGYSFK